MRLKSFFCRFVLGLCCVLSVRSAIADDYAYLTNHDPYYPHLKFPKLTTPQWVGEEGVDAVVVLAIDDMRDPVRYERFLRPILKRLKQIDGRAPVSIMTNSLNPEDAQLKQWLDEGLSIDVHTIDHPCPLLKDGDFKKAKSTYDRCVDLISQVKGNRPVAFRMPCCDSLNTVSPRFFAEIFNKTTAKGNYLTLDTSVFHIFSDRDPDLPRELLFDADGKERFRKYIPKDRGFVNTIENYPYPYVIGNLCWEFPCVVPSDWSAQHRHGVNNPATVSDLKAALDLTVIKKGVFNLVFHPHGWIKNTQVVDLIDHAVKKHGKKVKFLTFREAQDRLNRHLLKGQSLRDEKGKDRGVRLVDVNRDGYMDVMIGTGTVQKSRIWNPKKQKWDETRIPRKLTDKPVAIGAYGEYGTILFYKSSDDQLNTFKYDSLGIWDYSVSMDLKYTGPNKKRIQSIRSINLNGSRVSEVLVFSKQSAEIFTWIEEFRPSKIGYFRTPFDLPKEITTANKGNFLPGLRFIDINEDGLKDLVYSDHERYSLFLMDDMKTGWKTKVFAHKRTTKGATGSASAGKTPLTPLPDKPAVPHDEKKAIVLPHIVNEDGSNNGFFVHSHHLFWQNEHTAKLPHLVAKVSFHELLKDIKPRAKSPEMSLKAMQPRPGFQVQLVAAEPLVKDPVAFEWGADGKLWVAEMADYPLGLDGKGKSGGRIRVLQDTNRDGVYDRATIFLDGLNFPNGVMPWKKGVIVTAAPDIIYAEDTNGDGKADVKKVLYTGFGEGNQQHRVNGLVYGLDNWLYCANGDSHGFIRSTKLEKIVNIRGRDLRIQPDTGKLDTVTGQTQFGRNRDDWGNWFGCNNSNPMFHFVLEDRYIRRNPYVGTPSASVQVSVQPGAAPCYPISRPQPRFNDFNRLNRFTSACGAMIYRDTLFGKRFVQDSFVSEPVHNLVHREILKRTGVTFQSQRADDEQRSEFLSSRDNWFRPTMLKTGPDGALYIADMYREHIEHPEYIPKEQQPGLDFRNGHDKGRIYRIFPTGTKLKAIPNLAAMKTSELVAALDSSNGWQRDTAQRLLIERKDPSAVAPLKKMLVKNTNPLARLHAICTLSVLGKLDDEALIKSFRDKHPGVRRRAIRVGEYLFSGEDSKDVFSAMKNLILEDDLLVRMQLAYSLGNSGKEYAVGGLGFMLYVIPHDKYMYAAIMSSINRKNLGEILRISGISNTNENSIQILDRLVGMAVSMGEMEIVAKRVRRLVRLKSREIPSPRSMVSLADILDALRKRNRTLKSILSYVKDDKDKIEKQFKQFLRTADKIAFSEDPVTSDSDRIAAIRLLSYNWDDGSKFETLFQPKFSSAVQSAAVASLGKRTDKNIANVLLANWRSYGPSLRREVLETLLQKNDWVDVILEQLQQKKMHIAEIDAVHRQRLLNFPNFEVRSKAKTVFGSWKIDPNRQKVLTAYKSALELKANPVNGRLLFNKHCAVCHKLNGMGHVVGPDLAALKNKSSENLLVAILDPNRNIESKYLNYIVVTVAGKSHQGLLTDETGSSVTILAQEDKRTVIPRGEIDQLVSTTKSTMPEGLENDLKPQAIADIMAYVQKSGPTRKRKTFAGNAPALVKPDAKGALLLTPLNCEIYGPSLLLENKYGNLGFWSSPHDEAIWTIVVPKSGEYDIEVHWALPGNAGGTILFECGAERLSKQVPSTGSWDVYKKQSFGTIKLKKGVHHFAARSQRKIKGALIDLKSVRLVRIIE